MKQIYQSADDIVEGIKDGATILVGGFGLCGIPENVIKALVKKGISNLTIVSNNCGVDDWGLGLLLQKKQIKKIYASYVGENKEFERQVINGELEVELVPQGTLAERLRAGGAGIPAFYTPAGVGTPVAEGKEVRTFNGKEYLLEHAIRGDISIVRAHTGDTYGNLVYRKTAQNFNPMIAAAGNVTIAEVEHLQKAGNIDPHHIHTPGIYVNRIIEAVQENRVEKRTIKET